MDFVIQRLSGKLFMLLVLRIWISILTTCTIFPGSAFTTNYESKVKLRRKCPCHRSLAYNNISKEFSLNFFSCHALPVRTRPVFVIWETEKVGLLWLLHLSLIHWFTTQIAICPRCQTEADKQPEPPTNLRFFPLASSNFVYLLATLLRNCRRSCKMSICHNLLQFRHISKICVHKVSSEPVQSKFIYFQSGKCNQFGWVSESTKMLSWLLRNAYFACYNRRMH